MSKYSVKTLTYSVHFQRPLACCLLAVLPEYRDTGRHDCYRNTAPNRLQPLMSSKKKNDIYLKKKELLSKRATLNSRSAEGARPWETPRNSVKK